MMIPLLYERFYHLCGSSNGDCSHSVINSLPHLHFSSCNNFNNFPLFLTFSNALLVCLSNPNPPFSILIIVSIKASISCSLAYTLIREFHVTVLGVRPLFFIRSSTVSAAAGRL